MRTRRLEFPAIAVLPFINMSGEQENEYFADGMAEEIITGLAQCTGLSVVARNSSFAFRGRSVDVRQIGNELGATYVLEGSVRRSEKRLRITAQLIDARSGGHLWAERFEGDLSDVFQLQDRITESVVAVIEPKLLFAEAGRARRQPPRNLDAYDLYLRALSLINEYTAEATAAALQCLDKALEFDPNYAQAMAASACYRALSQLQGWTGNWRSRSPGQCNGRGTRSLLRRMIRTRCGWQRLRSGYWPRTALARRTFFGVH